MNVSDPIADMLTRIRNASRARHLEVAVPASRVKREIARILVEEGFISGSPARLGHARQLAGQGALAEADPAQGEAAHVGARTTA